MHKDWKWIFKEMRRKKKRKSRVGPEEEMRIRVISHISKLGAPMELVEVTCRFGSEIPLSGS